MLPAPKNGQVRAVPDERTIRYYGAIGLLDGPAAMRGRTALYGERHVAQIVAIKRMQGAGKSLAEIQALWPTMDDATLARMSGVAMPKSRRTDFWKRAAAPRSAPVADAGRAPEVAPPPAELHLLLTSAAALTLQLPSDFTLSPADLAALRAAAAPLIAELARRGLAPKETP
jgi:DNA-binding transcriptional MerR regulator